MKIVMTLAVLFMTTAIFAQQKRSMKAVVGERSATTLVRSAHVHANIKGVVRIDEACGLHVEVPVKDGVMNLFPVNMPEEFKIDGKNILFDYGKVDARIKSGCEVESAISVSNVKSRRVAHK